MIILLLVIILIGMGLGTVGVIGKSVSDSCDKNQKKEKKKETMLENCEKMCELLKHRNALNSQLKAASEHNDWTKKSMDHIEELQHCIKQLDEEELNPRIAKINIWALKS